MVKPDVYRCLVQFVRTTERHSLPEFDSLHCGGGGEELKSLHTVLVALLVVVETPGRQGAASTDPTYQLLLLPEFLVRWGYCIVSHYRDRDKSDGCIEL